MSEEIQSKTINVSEVAADLNVSRATVLRWIEAGKIPGFFRIGNKWLIRREEYEAFISNSKNIL
ncbi:MAG: helix-turn-helix domain-containing protein [bacterium]